MRISLSTVRSQCVIICILLALSTIAEAQKKGGERCEKDSECELKVCSSGKCDPCPDRNNCPPPGMCSESDLASYRRDVEKYCKELDRKCSHVQFSEDETDCSDLKARFEVAEKCVKARDDVMQRCFKGGDDAHVTERRNATEVREQCREMISYKRGVNACYNCSPSDYNSYREDQRRACDKTIICEERKDDAKVNCSKIEEKWQNGKECQKAQEYIVGRCFDGRRNSRRERWRQDAERAVDNCKEVLDYKRDKKICE